MIKHDLQYWSWPQVQGRQAENRLMKTATNAAASQTLKAWCVHKLFFPPPPGNREQLLVRFCKEPNTITLNLQGSFIPWEFTTSIKTKGFPGGSDGKESACNAGDPGSIPGLGRFPWRREWQPTPVFLPGKSHGQKSLVGYSSWGCKELDRTEQLTQSTNSVVLTICYSSNRKPIHRWTQSIYCWCIVDLSRVHEQPFRLHCFYQPTCG